MLNIVEGKRLMKAAIIIVKFFFFFENNYNCKVSKLENIN